MRGLLGIALAAIVVIAHAATAVAQDSVDCSAFRRNADNTWTVIKPTTVKIGQVTQAMDSSTFSRNGINLGGTDLATYLEQRCTRS
jgi:hypothetical protein